MILKKIKEVFIGNITYSIYVNKKKETFVDFKSIYKLLNKAQSYSNWSKYAIGSFNLIKDKDYILVNFKHKLYFYLTLDSIKTIVNKRKPECNNIIEELIIKAEDPKYKPNRIEQIQIKDIEQTKENYGPSIIKEKNIIDCSLVKIYEEDGHRAVNARELYTFLNVKAKFADWIRNKIKQYDFIPEEEFIIYNEPLSNGGRLIQYVLSLDMAKELAMLENNEQGKKARKYFLNIEKKYKKILSSPQNESKKLITSQDIINKIDSMEERIKKLENKTVKKPELNKKIYTYSSADIAKEMELYSLTNKEHVTLIDAIATHLKIIEFGDNFEYNSYSYKDPIFFNGKIVGKKMYYSKLGADKIKKYLIDNMFNIFSIITDRKNNPKEILCKIENQKISYHLKVIDNLYDVLKRANEVISK